MFKETLIFFSINIHFDEISFQCDLNREHFSNLVATIDLSM